ncbi:hypothetical protein Cob_v001529 [Colletotrichum orbiculare MAFF 240422]|uniref:Uncharacterized protein n=1 Tax=Colletotrichum orbiculare (strain 104-T / ATCC 96160 / CBS 514.97 / LARS 414 / MAFF 240422) TaxID=1213857 RepID=A0A484G4S6_COLOR|nr:hypothetical protein Cob_v001529 [Colletotrichum orbiculare MAFF 240422]
MTETTSKSVVACHSNNSSVSTPYLYQLKMLEYPIPFPSDTNDNSSKLPPNFGRVSVTTWIYISASEIIPVALPKAVIQNLTSTTRSESVVPGKILPGTFIATSASSQGTSRFFIESKQLNQDRITLSPVVINFVGLPEFCFDCSVSPIRHVKFDVLRSTIHVFGLKSDLLPGPLRHGRISTKTERGDNAVSKQPHPSSEDDRLARFVRKGWSFHITGVWDKITCYTYTVRREVPGRKSYRDALVASGSSIETPVVTTSPVYSFPLATRGPAEYRHSQCVQFLSQRSRPYHVPLPGKWTSPSDYNMPELFMPCEVFQAYKNSSKHGPKAVPFPPEEYGDRTSHSWVAFQNEVEGLAVHGLYGCTSIVVVSRRGAWACHIWQPTFDVDSLEDKETFRREAYQHIHWGSNDKFAEYGLEELRDNIGVGSSRNLFGDSSNSAVELGTQVFIMTPRPPLPFEYPDGDFLPYEAVDDAYGNVGLIRYEEGIDMIWEDMVKTFGDVPIEVVDYAPRLALSDQDQDHVRAPVSADRKLVSAALEKHGFWEWSAKVIRGLANVGVDDAGHVAPINVPEAVCGLLNNWFGYSSIVDLEPMNFV